MDKSLYTSSIIDIVVTSKELMTGESSLTQAAPKKVIYVCWLQNSGKAMG